jgi:hypothetical protein
MKSITTGWAENLAIMIVDQYILMSAHLSSKE